MKKIFKKGLSIILATAVLFSVPIQPAIAASTQVVKANGLDVIEQKNTDSTLDLKYYLTVEGKTTLYTEHGEIRNNTYKLETISVDVDKNNKPISETKEVISAEYPITASKISNDSNITTGMQLFSTGEWKEFSTTYNFKAKKFTAGAITAGLIAAIGVGTGGAGAIGLALVEYCVGYGINEIPNSVYFEGQRRVSRSTGKIYYRYKGDFYTDSSKSELLKADVSWSKRWGH